MIAFKNTNLLVMMVYGSVMLIKTLATCGRSVSRTDSSASEEHIVLYQPGSMSLGNMLHVASQLSE